MYIYIYIYMCQAPLGSILTFLFVSSVSLAGLVWSGLFVFLYIGFDCISVFSLYKEIGKEIETMCVSHVCIVEWSGVQWSEVE